jgi:hypothetical protein
VISGRLAAISLFFISSVFLSAITTTINIKGKSERGERRGNGEGGFKAREKSSVRLKVRFSMAINVDPPAPEAMDLGSLIVRVVK